MGFKLGASKGLRASGGNIKSKFGFKNNQTPIFRKSLEAGTLGRANMDGSIEISNKLEPGSAQEQKVIKEELKHITDIKSGELAYGDNYIRHKGVTFPRKTIEGKDMVKIDGKWKETGRHDLPWEAAAKS